MLLQSALALVLPLAASAAAIAKPGLAQLFKGRSVLDATRSINGSRIVNATYAAALKVVTDPPTLIKLSPLVTNVVQDATTPTLYHITDSISMLGISIPTCVSCRETMLV